MVLQISVRKVFSHLPGGLEHFRRYKKNIPQNQSTIVHPSLAAAAQQTFLLLLCIPLFQQHQLSPIDGVWMYNDSMISFHRFTKFQRIVCVNDFRLFRRLEKLSKTPSPSPEKFLFGTDKTDSIEWLNLVPRLRIGDCSEIHPHWRLCDLQLSSH